MNLWISTPRIVVPDFSAKRSKETDNVLYERIYASYGMAFRNEECSVTVPTWYGSAESLAAPAIEAVLKDSPRLGDVRSLFDCRSGAQLSGPAPTYVLAQMTGLHKAIPVALHSQGGTELAQAVLFLEGDKELAESGVIVASQRVAPPDPRMHSGRLPLADGAAAVRCCSTSQPCGAGFRVRWAGIIHQETLGTDAWVASEIANAGFERQDFRWVIQSPLGFDLPLRWAKSLTVHRSRWKDVDFGCADALVSLSELLATNSLPPGLGCILMRANFGGLAILLLECTL
jgi:hypothetical protein